MTDIPTPRQQLITENDELRARLGEAEETLRAIRNSEVDALVLAGLEGDYIHALEGGLEPYRVMVESMNEGAFTLAVDGTILYSNSRFAERVKQPLGQIVGTPLTELLADQDRERLETMLTQAAKEESRGALTLQAADGTQTPTLFSMSPLPQSDGQVISVVTADLSAVIAAAEARARLALIVESSDDAIVSTTLDGIVESWNRAAEQLYGYAAGEAIGQSIESLTIPPGLTDEVTHELEAIRRGKRTLLTDTVRRRKDGSLVDVSIKASPILDDAGNIVGASINARDITQRKRAEQAILDEQRFSDTLIQSLPDIFFLLDHDGCLLRWNDRLEELFGLSPEEMSGSNALAFIHDEERSQVAGRLRQAFDSGSAVAEARMNLTNGLRDYLLTGNRVETELGVNVIGIGFDITERKRSEARIKYLNRVLSVLSGINTLIVRVSDHEELFREACNIAVKAGGFRMAMIVIVDRYSKQPVSVISAGKDDALLTDIKAVMSTTDGMQTTLVAQAIREKKNIIANNTQKDPRLIFGKQYAEAGVNSMSVLPLIISDEVVGTVVLYASEVEFFQQDEVKLLSELAGDIAFAMDHIDKHERLNYLAYFDVLTGLANRSLFLDRMAQYMHSATSGHHKLAIGMIDLERFKSINDSLGRPATPC